MTMLKRKLATSAVFAFAVFAITATPAFAGSCPRDMKEIDALMSKAKVSASVMSEVKELRAEGEKLHKSGSHPASVAALHKAKKLLGM